MRAVAQATCEAVMDWLVHDRLTSRQPARGWWGAPSEGDPFLAPFFEAATEPTSSRSKHVLDHSVHVHRGELT
jgi:hypothetical protein